MTAWEQLEGTLAADLPVLGELDTVLWRANGRCVQMQQTRLSLGLAVVSNEYLPAERALTAEEEQQLAEWGWQQPDDGDLNWHIELAWPITTAQGAQAAALLCRTMRLVLRVTETSGIATTRTTSYVSDPRRRRRISYGNSRCAPTPNPWRAMHGDVNATPAHTTEARLVSTQTSRDRLMNSLYIVPNAVEEIIALFVSLAAPLNREAIGELIDRQNWAIAAELTGEAIIADGPWGIGGGEIVITFDSLDSLSADDVAIGLIASTDNTETARRQAAQVYHDTLQVAIAGLGPPTGTRLEPETRTGFNIGTGVIMIANGQNATTISWWSPRRSAMILKLYRDDGYG